MKTEIVSFILASMIFLSFQIASLDFPLSVGISYVREEADRFYIGNDLLEIGFSKEFGAVTSVLHKKSGVDLISSSIEREVWAVGMYSENRERFWTTSQMSDSFTYSSSPLANGSQLSFQWANSMFGDGAPPSYQLEVQANVSVFDTSPLSEWKINVFNEGQMAIEYITFPSISGIGILGPSGEDDVLLSPTGSAGELRYSPYIEGIQNYWFWGVDPPGGLRETLLSGGNPYPSMHFNMQFMAIYDSNAGFYFACNDSAYFTKDWIFGVDENEWLGYRPLHYPPLIFGESHSVPYTMLIGVFEGDWQDAADLYKEWAHQQWWYVQKPVHPEWMKEVQIGHSVGFDLFDKNYSLLLECTNYGKEYFGIPLLVDFGYSFTDLGEGSELFPPYGGWNKFDEFVTKLHRSGHRIAVQINPGEILTESPLWKSGEAEPFAVKNDDGSLCISQVADGTVVSMCLQTEYWQQKIAEIIFTLVEHGVDIVHLDGVPESLIDGCFDPDHGHVLGRGGNHCANAIAEFLSDVTQAIRQINPDACLMGMGIAEISLPILSTYQVAAGGWGVADYEFQYPSDVDVCGIVPLFEYVYRGHFVVASHSGDFRGLTATAFVLSRLLTWGMMPLFCGSAAGFLELHFTPWVIDPMELEITDMFRRIAFARTNYAHDFLILGAMLRTPKIPSPKILIKSSDPEARFEFERFSIQHVTYRSPRDDIGYIFTNIGNETLSFDLDVNLSLFGMPEQNFAYFVRDGSYQTIGPTSNQFNSTFQIEPREILLVVVTRDPVGKPDLWVSYSDLPYFGSELHVNRSIINVTLWNTGPVDSAVFNVSVSADWENENFTEVLAVETVENLCPGENVTLQIPFISDNLGQFNLTVEVDPENTVAEMNEMNNEANVKLKAGTWGLTDLNNDGTVNIVDISMVAVAFNSHPGDPNWNVIADIDNNEWVNIIDVSKVAVDYGKTT